MVKSNGNSIVGDNNTQFNINLQISETEEKNIKLSDNERLILELLAEGCKIAYVRDGSGMICCTHLFGDGKNSVSDESLLEMLPLLLKKGLVEFLDDSHCVISPFGKRIIQWLVFNGK